MSYKQDELDEKFRGVEYLELDLLQIEIWVINEYRMWFQKGPDAEDNNWSRTKSYKTALATTRRLNKIFSSASDRTEQRFAYISDYSNGNWKIAIGNESYFEMYDNCLNRNLNGPKVMGLECGTDLLYELRARARELNDMGIAFIKREDKKLSCHFGFVHGSDEEKARLKLMEIDPREKSLLDVGRLDFHGKRRLIYEKLALYYVQAYILGLSVVVFHEIDKEDDNNYKIFCAPQQRHKKEIKFFF